MLLILFLELIGHPTRSRLPQQSPSPCPEVKTKEEARMRPGLLTCVRAGNEPQTAIFLGGVFQSDPEAHHFAQRACVQESRILVWGH